MEDLQAHNVLDALEEMGWVAQLSSPTQGDHDDLPYVLLVKDNTPLQPLVEKLLLANSKEAQHLQDQGQWSHLCVRNVLEPCANSNN